jgi:hypothetical protein
MMGRGIKSFFNKNCIMPLPTMPLPVMPLLWRDLSAKSPPATLLHFRICHSINPQTSPMSFPWARLRFPLEHWRQLVLTWMQI